MNNFLTPKDVAKILKINYRKVLDMIAMGELPAYQIGGLFRISEKDIHSFLESVKVQSYWKNS